MTDALPVQRLRIGGLDQGRARRVLGDILYRHVVAVKKTTSMAGMTKWYDLFAVQRTVEGREILTWISGLIDVAAIESLPTGRVVGFDNVLVKVTGTGFSPEDALSDALSLFRYPEGEGRILVQVV